MVRERVNNKVFTDAFFLPCPADDRKFVQGSLFPVERPIELDIGCGRGRFLLARAQSHPDVNFLGIDRSLLRLRKIDRRAVAANLDNIRLINADAMAILPRLPDASASAIYVFYPDPWPKRRHQSRRLIAPLFIERVFHILVPGGIIHLCTDHEDYFAAMTRFWGADTRFRSVTPFLPNEDEETDFGLLFRAQERMAGRCSFQKRADQGC